MKKRGNPEKTKYRQSSQWKNLRKRIIQERGSQCEVCGKKTKVIQLHHKDDSLENYKSQNPDDFVLVCVDCHKQISSLERIKPENWYKIRNKDWVDFYSRFLIAKPSI